MSREKPRLVQKMFKIYADIMGRIPPKWDIQILPRGDDIVISYPKTTDMTNVDAISNALDCSLKQIENRKKLSARLAKDRLPEIPYRITLDYQTCYEIEESDELNSGGPNWTHFRKIGSKSPENIVAVGEELYKVVKSFPLLFQKYKLESIGKYLNGDKTPYSIYQLTRHPTSD